MSLANGIYGALVALRTAAARGDAGAARELGRLLSLVPADPDRPDDAVPQDNEYPGVPWLRRALDADPGDTVAALLLASRLHQRYDQASSVGDEDEEPFPDEAAALYRRVLAADPENPGAALALAILGADRRHLDDDPVGSGPAELTGELPRSATTWCPSRRRADRRSTSSPS